MKVFASATCGCLVELIGEPSPLTLSDIVVGEVRHCKKHRGRRATGAPSYGGDTSKAAGESILHAIHAMEEKIYESLVGNPGTAHEVSSRTGINIVTARARINQLMERGLVRDSGERRKTPSGRESRVWELACPNCGHRPHPYLSCGIPLDDDGGKCGCVSTFGPVLAGDF
jgi:hypothetical protein